MTVLENAVLRQMESEAHNANDNAGLPASWAQQDPVLRDLWAQNVTPDEIGNRLGRSVAAVMTRAARLGLPRRSSPGRKPLVRTAGAATTPRQRPARAFTQEMFKDVLGPNAARAMRTCLMCVHPFQSAGSHNRICPKCKGSPDYEAGNRIADIDLY
jgi:hypothetical protein